MACPIFQLDRKGGNYFKKPVLVSKDSWFVGEANKDFVPCGVGYLLKPDGSYYEGYFKNGLYEGKGRIFLQTGQVCEGIWVNGALDKGTIFFSNEKVYTGEINNFLACGEGTEESDEYVYEGPFVNGLKHGVGKVVWSDENQYEGEFFKGKIEGVGKHIWEDRTYEGQWKANKMHGRGIITWNDGRTYEGSLVNGIKEGYGTMTEPNRKYSGYWKDGKEDGKGTLEIKDLIIKGIWHKGKIVRKFSEANKNHSGKEITEIKLHEKYRRKLKKILKVYSDVDSFDKTEQENNDFDLLSGIWVKFNKGLFKGNLDDQDKPQGQATFINENEIYEGGFEAGFRIGYGKCITINRDVFFGGWMQDLKSGYGTLKSKDMRYEGEWRSDLFHGQGKLSTSSYTYSGEFSKGKFHGKGVLKNQDSTTYSGCFVKGSITGIGTFTNQEGTSIRARWAEGKVVELLGQSTQESQDQDTLETVRSLHCIRFKDALLNY